MYLISSKLYSLPENVKIEEFHLNFDFDFFIQVQTLFGFEEKKKQTNKKKPLY